MWQHAPLDGEILFRQVESKESYAAVDKFQYEIHVDDGVVVEMVKKPKWD